MDGKDLDALSRQGLYDLVWSEAMAMLAPRYGISDVALKKRCARQDVPTPPRGYWAKLEAGKRVKKTPLPKTPAPREEKRPPQSEDEVRKLPPPARDYKIARPHALVSYTREILRSRSAAYNGLLHAHGDGALRTSVAPASLRRALWLWDAVLKRLEAEGVTCSREGSLTDGKHSAPLSLKEKLSKYETPHSPSTGSASRIRPHLPVHPLDVHPLERSISHLVPNGTLYFQTERVYGSSLRSEWKESLTIRLEERLDEIATGVVAILRHKEEQAIARAESERRRREQERAAYEESQRLRHQRGRRKRLGRAASALEDSDELRALADALLARSRAEDIPGLTGLVEWIRECADRRDPVEGILADLRAGRDPMEPAHEDLYDPSPRSTYEPRAGRPW